MSARFWMTLYLLFIVLQLPAYYRLGYASHRWESLQKKGEDIVEESQDPGRFERAREVFYEQLDLCEQQDWHDARLGMTYYNIGAMFWAERNYDRARGLFVEAQRNFEVNNGPQSYYTSAVRARLGDLDMMQGHRESAEEHLKQAISGIGQFMGPDDSLYLRSRAKLGILYFFHGRYQEAREQLYPIADEVNSDENVGDNVFKNQVASAVKNLRLLK